jgi:hypothetical protein
LRTVRRFCSNQRCGSKSIVSRLPPPEQTKQQTAGQRPSALQGLSTFTRTWPGTFTCTPTPVPAAPLTKVQERAAGQPLRIARQLLPEHEFRLRYLDNCQPTRAIARDVGVSPDNVLRLANDYGIPMRKSGRQRQHDEIDRDWLFEQYVNRRRTLPDLAREKRISNTTMAKWARELGIPVRPSGGRSHGAYLQKGMAREADAGQGRPTETDPEGRIPTATATTTLSR